MAQLSFARQFENTSALSVGRVSKNGARRATGRAGEQKIISVLNALRLRAPALRMARLRAPALRITRPQGPGPKNHSPQGPNPKASVMHSGLGFRV